MDDVVIYESNDIAKDQSLFNNWLVLKLLHMIVEISIPNYLE